MIQKYSSHIIIALLLIGLGQGFLNSPDSNDDLYRERINQYKKEKIEDLQKIDSLNRNLITFQHEVHKIDSITNSYTNNQLDSFYTDFFR